MNKVMHNLLSIFIPFFSICTVYTYIAGFFPKYTALTIAELSIVLVTGLLCQFIYSITRAERVSKAAYARIAVFMYIIFWIIIFFVNKGSLTQRLSPSFSQFLLLIMLTLQFLWAMYLSKHFFEYEQFLDFCKSYKGTELFSRLREQGELITSSNKALNFCVVLSFIPLIIIGVISLLYGRDLYTVQTKTLVFASVSCFFSAFTYTYVRLTSDERYYAGQGLEVVFEKSKKRFRFSIVLILLCAVLAFLYARPDALFVANGQTPFYKLFIAWLFRLLRSRKQKEVDILPQFQEFEDLGMEQMPNLFMLPNNADTLIDLSWLFNILKIVSVAAIGVLLLVVFFGPFFKKDWINFWKEKKLLKYLKRLLKTVKELITSLFFGNEQNKKNLVLSESAKKLSKSLEEFALLKKSKEKKAEIGRLSKKYVELCAWGEQGGSPCSKATAPYEYAAQLFEHTLWYKEELFTIAQIFEKALFSASLITNEEEKEFYKLVDIILAITLKKPEETSL